MKAGINRSIVVVVLAVLTSYASAQAATLTVGPGLIYDFTSIQSAIYAAKEGDTVVVAMGTYEEKIVFNGPNIVLTSTDPDDPAVVEGTIIKAYYTAAVLTFTGNEDASCELRGLTITNGRLSGILGNGTKAAISNCLINDNRADYDGGGLNDCDGPISGCIIANNSVVGMDGQPGKGGGLHGCDGPITNCIIRNNEAGQKNLNGYGGGLYECNGAITNCTISNNSANGTAGGLHSCQGAITGCTITGNSAVGDGGALYDCDGPISGCTISGNKAEHPSFRSKGGGLYRCDGTINGCTISDNEADELGGGMYGCSGRIEDCTILRNRSTGWNGGGLAQCGAVINCVISDNWAAGSGGGLERCPTVSKCTISGNRADVYAGGGLSLCESVSNCVIAGNSAGTDGGGLDRCHSVTNCFISGSIAAGNGAALYECAEVFNCTVIGNIASGNGGAIYYSGNDATVANCILWDNKAAKGNEIYLGACVPTRSGHLLGMPVYSDVQGGAAGVYVPPGCPLDWEPSNIQTDPRFVQPGYWSGDGMWTDGDYHLLPSSPCINAGYPGSLPQAGETDLDDNPRIIGAVVDMGAYELQEVPLPPDGSLKASDPTPPDGTKGVTSSLLEWESGETAKWHDVYLGTNPTPGAAEYKGRQPLAWAMWFELRGWVAGTTYYWRIDEVEADGTTIHTGDVWSFTAASLTAYDPHPPDGAEGVTSPLLEWESGETATWHDIYVGTSPTPGAGEFKARQPLNWNMYFHQEPLIPGAAYYWRIDEVEEDGTTIHTGDVWSFTAAPLTACNPNPPDGAKYVNTDADLSWTGGFRALTHDVYFGTSQSDVVHGTGGTFKGSQSERTYDCGTLAIATTYYWRIDEVERDGTTKHRGVVWSFTTFSPGPVELEITGPDEVFEQSSAQYNAVAYYADGSTKDVTTEAIWSVHSPGCASIDGDGLLTTEAIDEAKIMTVYAAYTEGGITVHAEKPVWCVPQIVEANRFYVHALTGSDFNDGLTPETAFATIQKSIDSAVNGDTVIVADGTYTGQGNRDINLKGKAITLRSENGAESCVIDCLHKGRGFYFGHDEDADTVVEGFTIMNGSADNGGGIYCSSSPTISHCIMRLNEAKHGAGLAVRDFAEPTIVNCLICENLCTGFGGGGIDCHNASPMIVNCTIADNSTKGEGGGIAARGNSYPILTNCILWADTPYEISLAGGALASVTHCDVQGGWPGEGNVNADPRFVEMGEGLVSYWKFDEGEGEIAYDSAGTNDGIVHGAQWVTGQVGTALNFDGFLDYVALADESFDDLGSNVTFSAWVYRNRTFPSGQEVIFAYSDSASDHWYLYFSLSWDVVTYYCRKGRGSGDDCLYLGSTPIDEGKWYHLVVVVDGTGTRAYINSQREDFTKQPAAECAGAYCFPEICAEAEKARIGILTRLTGQYDDFDGKIDELRIFNRALSAGQIQQLYQDGLVSPVAHWKFDEAEGEIAYDSVRDNHGTIHGARWTAGQIEGALDFDGVDDYVDVHDPLDIDLDTTYSVSAWVNIHNMLPTYGVIAAHRHQTTPSVLFQLDRAAADVRFVVRDDAGNIAIATSFEALTADSWYHIAGVRKGGDLSIYVNGEAGTSGSNEFGQMIPNGLKFGATECCSFGVHHHFSGSIDDVRIYDQALSVEEVESLCRPSLKSKRADYRLSADSPCIDAGDPEYQPEPDEKDLNGNPRVTGDAIDMGAFESQPLIGVHMDKFLFEGMVGYPNPPDQILLLHNAGAGTLNWQISSDCSWLEVDPDSGRSKGYGNTAWLRVDTTGLAAGEYDCELMISAPLVMNSPRIIHVSLIVRENCFPDTPDYAQQYADFVQYVAHGADPSCWCASLWDGTHYQCDGDASGKHQTFTEYRVYGDDLALLISNWKRKIDTADPCADFDHKAETFLNYRVYGNDLAILIANWKKRDADLPGDCPRPDGQ